MSLDLVRRRLFGRIVIWDPNGGSIIDLSSREVLSFGGPSESEEYARLANGSNTVVNRSHTVQIPIVDNEAIELLETLSRTESKVKCAFIGIEGTDTWMWLEPTIPHIKSPEVDPGSLSQKVLELDNSIFYPAIWQGMSIIEGVPWRGTTQQTRNNNNVLRPKGSPRSGYNGPLWNVPPSTSVDLVGNADTISDASNPDKSAILEFEFPVWGCEILLESEESITCTISPLDWNKNALTFQNPLVIPEETWYIRLIVDSANRPPNLNQVTIGEPYGVLEGNVSTDFSRVSDPLWTKTSLTLTGENI